MDPVRNAPGPRPKVRIGDWSVDPGTNELRRGKEVARLEPKAMDVLMLLAQRAGEVVSRDELFAAVWPGAVVGDEALSQSITKLRRALGDDPRAPTYIETISKRGYRLAAPIGGESPAPPAARTHPRGGIAAAGLLGLAAIAAVLVLAWPDAAPPADASRGKPAQWITVTVLPFESLGSDERQAGFARGIADSLMTELGRLSAVRVIGASGITPAQAAQRARYAVSGSVQRDAASVAVNVRLVDTATGEQLWSDRLQRPVGELFALQDEITGKLVQSLPAKAGESERRRLSRRHTSSLEAYELFLRAQALFLARGERENLEARELYRRAIGIDPRFARAYSGLAMTHAMEPRLGGAPGATPGLERALALARTAREIDPEIAEVHWALGFVHTQARRYPQALRALERAIELNPSFADAHALMGGIYTYLGQPAKTIPLLRTAMRLDPGSGYLHYLILGRAYFFEGDMEQALINLRAALLRNPADLETRLYTAAALLASGNRAGAEWEAEEVRALDRGFTLARWLEGYPLASAAHRERLREALARLFAA